ncbi:cold shock domain-containing protein [Celeribacter arenosi]|uniref:Cold shock domain-containing protein n=1 Tax=Celeribacter arenosi TaxID=792649 RepID=A0ABP7KD61_9RHOB
MRSFETGIMGEDNSRNLISGHVKWFDPTRGFGFVVAEDGGPDILLHANVLRNFGQSSIADGSAVTVSVQHTDRGVQALEVHEVVPPEGDGRAALEDLDFPDTDHSDLPLEPARVKWFDKGKGFGFANVFARPEDVFIHVEVLRRSGLADLQPGEAIGLRVIDGRRGRMAALITSWDSALRGENEPSEASEDVD